MAEDKITIYGELKSGVPGGYVTTADQVKGLDVISPMTDTTYEELVALAKHGALVPGMKYRFGYLAAVRDVLSVNSTNIVGLSSTRNISFITVTAINEFTLSDNALMTTLSETVYDIKYSLYAGNYNWADEESANFSGVIYWMRDKNGNEAPYDFINIYFVENEKKIYTFSTIIENQYVEASETSDLAKNNVIKENLVGLKYYIPFNYFVVDGLNYARSINNYIGFNSHDIIINENCSHNVIGNNCVGITINKTCNNNIFEQDCGKEGPIILGDSCNDNTFKTLAGFITLKQGCTGNVFELSSSNITLGKQCLSNHFGSCSGTISLGNYCTGNYFGKNNRRINFHYSGTTDPIKPLLDYVCYNHFDDDVCYFSFYSSVNPTEAYPLKHRYVYSGNYSKSIIENKIPTESICRIFLVSDKSYQEKDPGISVPARNNTGQDTCAILFNMNDTTGWVTTDMLWKRFFFDKIRSYKNVEFFDGIKDGVLANIVEAVSVMKIDGIYYYKGRKCFVAKSGDNFYMSWGNPQSSVNDYNEGGLARMDRIFEVEDTRYCFNGEDLVLYES